MAKGPQKTVYKWTLLIYVNNVSNHFTNREFLTVVIVPLRLDSMFVVNDIRRITENMVT